MNDQPIEDPSPATDAELAEAEALLKEAGDLVSDVEYSQATAIISTGTGAQVRALISRLKRLIKAARPEWEWEPPTDKSSLDDGPP